MMKKDNIKKPNLSVKKTSAKGVILKSSNAARIAPRSAENAEKISADSALLRKLRGKPAHLMAVFVAMILVGAIVVFQFLPEKARSKTFTFFQTAKI